MECCVCYGPDAATLPCGHLVCETCLQAHLRTRVTDGQDTPCPHPGCEHEIPVTLVADRAIACRRQQTRLEQLMARTAFVRCETVRHIGGTAVPCNRWCAPAPGGTAQCDDAQCKAFRALAAASADPGELDAALVTWRAGTDAAQCPGCKVLIERKGGCEHMTCKCGTEFCYLCGEDWSYAHECN